MKEIDFSNDLKELLLRRFKWFEDHIFDQEKNTEYNYLTLAQTRIFALMRGRDMTISDLAKRMGVSRQAVQKTISTLVDHGLLELRVCPNNRSAKLIKITAEGHRLRSRAKKAIENAERDLARKIGPNKVKLLKEVLCEDWD